MELSRGECNLADSTKIRRDRTAPQGSMTILLQARRSACHGSVINGRYTRLCYKPGIRKRSTAGFFRHSDHSLMTHSSTGSGGCLARMATLRHPAILAGILIPILLATSFSVQAQEDFSDLADRLIEMRGEVDSLQSELNVQRDEHKNRMAYLTAQLADLEASKDREALRVRQLEEDLEEMQLEVAEAGDTSETLAPIVLKHIGLMRDQVGSGFPFKVRERLTALDEIANQLESGVINAQRAVNRLWAFVEDEIRMSRENAIYSQSIQLGGANVLVDVAKLGTTMMYFRTKDKEYGRAVPGTGGWRFEILESADDQKQVAELFDSLRKQIRQGYFHLPNALPAQGASS